MRRYVLMLVAAIFFSVVFPSAEILAAGRKDKKITVEHPWSGARVAFLGDSITDRNVLKDNTHYWAFLQEWLDVEPLVYGISGHQWTNIPGQAQNLKNDHGDDFDAIMIFVGTNDFNSGIPLGQWFSETSETVNSDGKMVLRTKRVPVMDERTYRGRINKVLDQLKRTFPTKQIVLVTPIHRAFASFGEDNVQPQECYQNSCGEYIDAYVQAIKEASSIWSVPVIDTFSLSGLFPMHEEQKIYFPGGTDWLHPVEEGHKRFALCLYYQLLMLPCRLDACPESLK